MTPEEFGAKWQGVTASERQAAQSHFEDLCRLIGVQTPLEADPSGTWYAYEKNVLKLDGRPGPPTYGEGAALPGSTRATRRT